MMKRRQFLRAAAGGGALAALGDLGFLGRLPVVSGAEARLGPSAVGLHAEIEPLVRLLEETARERVLEEVAARIRSGTSYREVLAALLMAGVRNIQPRPVGFKFHAVLVVNSAHLASLASPDTDRWLPIFWAIDYFKSSQAADAASGDWVMGPVDEARVPPSHRARAAFFEAMERWDEGAADAAVVGWARTAGAHELFEGFCRYGVRDFRDIGHKAIYVANSFRTLEAIGWHHAEPVLRSLAYALLDRSGDANPAQSDMSADRPYRRNIEVVKSVRAGWLDGEPSEGATAEYLETLRSGSPAETSEAAVACLNRGVSPASLFAAYFNGAGELLMRAPGIISLHAVTFTNAVHYAWQHCRDETTRKLLLLQNAAFLPLYRRRGNGGGVRIDELKAESAPADGPEAIAEIFAEVSRDRLGAARRVLGWLQAHPDPGMFAAAARRLIFLKGSNSHDYKFSSAVFEDYLSLRPPWRDRFLAASVFSLRGSGDADNGLVQRTREALR